jgi:hypothetical protein
MFQKIFTPFNKRSELPKQVGAALLKLSAARAGNPSYAQDSRPHRIEPWVASKIRSAADAVAVLRTAARGTKGK